MLLRCQVCSGSPLNGLPVQAEELVDFYRNELANTFNGTGLTYGDNLYASKRTTKALSEFMTRQVSSSASSSSSIRPSR